jgi:hypothetical protein
MGRVPPTVIYISQGEVPFYVVLLFRQGSNTANMPPVRFQSVKSSICSL